jgi:uncharacterized protein YhaN
MINSLLKKKLLPKQLRQFTANKMSIQIKNINVKNLGPISELKWKLGNLNLVFGNNEAGKSYLVEFLIHSLFKAKKWSNLRNSVGTGKVILSGLGRKNLEFSPQQKTKLKDKLMDKQEYLGLPPDFSKLLVVRPTDIELGNSQESDKLMLRRFLSHKEILDQIEDNIEQESVKTCQINGYTISGDSRGKIKEHQQLQKKLNKIDTLFDQVEEKYFGGELFQLKEQQQSLKDKQDQIKKAKRYQACQLDQQKKALEEKINQINPALIDQLMSDHHALERDQAKLDQQEKELQSLKNRTQDFQWLTQAIDIYQEHNLQAVADQPRLLVLVGLASGFLITATLFLLGITIGAVISLAATAVIAGVLIKLQTQYLDNYGQLEELKKLKAQFENKFNQPLNSLADLKAEKEKMAKKHQKKELLEDEIIKTQRKLSSEKAVLIKKASSLLDQDVNFDNCQRYLDSEKQKKQQLEEELNEIKQQLARLGVDEQNYLKDQPEINYDAEKERELSRQKEELKNQIQIKQNELDSLKHQILAKVDLDAAQPIEQLIDPLAQKREQVLAEYKQLTAEIIAKKNVYEVIKQLYQAEDEKIDRVLNSSLIQDLLPKITTRYQTIDLKKESLMVKDEYDSFPVSQLSSGAKEQVFLALRIALASEWFKEGKMFLILDDAFIHSDQYRKAELVKKIIELSQAGWQIICFSFDDRIKDLFDQTAKDYSLLNLNKV